MTQTYWCPDCAADEVAKMRADMAAARVPAPEQAKAITRYKGTHAGWKGERCEHRRCGPRRMPPAVREALLGEKPAYPRPAPSDEARSYEAIAARNAPLESTPEHVAAARRGDELAADRERREREQSRREKAQRWDESLRAAEERARRIRKQMKAQGLFEAKQPAGPRMDYDDYLDFVAYKAPELPWEACRRYGRDAIRVAVEFVCERRQGGDKAAAILRYAERVQRGLVRNWVRKDVYDALPPEQQADQESRHHDAFVHMEGQEEDNELTFWDGGPSKQWRERQAGGSTKFEEAARARGLVQQLKGLPQ